VTAFVLESPESVALAKDHRGGRRLWHRMGDVGYLDERRPHLVLRRKSQRVVTPDGTFFTIPARGLQHASAVFRTALVGVGLRGSTGLGAFERDKNNRCRKTP